MGNVCEGNVCEGLGARRMQSREGEDARGEAVRGDERRRDDELAGQSGDGATAFMINGYDEAMTTWQVQST